MSNQKAVLTVVETLPGQKLNLNTEEIYDPEFWKPYLPINTKNIEKTGEKTFNFIIDDKIQLDPTGSLSTKYFAQGTMKVDLVEVSEQKGGRWTFDIKMKNPFASITGVIRARNLVSALKVGVFLYNLEFDLNELNGYGKGAVMFALRLYIRKMLQNFKM